MWPIRHQRWTLDVSTPRDHFGLTKRWQKSWPRAGEGLGFTVTSPGCLQSMIVHCKQLKSVWAAGGEIRRRLVTVNMQPIVLLSKTHPILKPCFTTEQWNEFSSCNGIPKEMESEVQQWNRGLRFSYNCHAMSVGGLVGLGADEWLEGTKSRLTLNQNPAQALLDTFFTKVASHQTAEDLPAMRSDDVVVYRDDDEDTLVHSGRVRLIDGETHLMSKFGEYPTLITPFQLVSSEYAGQFNRLDIYRLNAESCSQVA